MTQVRTAVIPVGGFGTRFLPATKTIPKEMFPVGNKPVILHVVEEVLSAGIQNIIFVVNHHKHTLENFFSRNEMLEQYYQRLGKGEKVEELISIAESAQFSYVYSEPPMGNGGALRSVEHLVGREPFVLVWGDEFFLNTNKHNRIRQCCDVFEKFDIPVVSAFKVSTSRLSRYGVASGVKEKKGMKNVVSIKKIVEKPDTKKAPSNLAILGTYVLTYDIFTASKKVKVGKGGELWLTDLINEMAKKTGLLAKVVSNAHYLDCGNPHDYLLSQIEYALAHPKIDPHIKKHIKKLLASYSR